MADRGQLSLSEALVSAKVGRNEMLDRLIRDVKWCRFEKLLLGLKPEGAGRPPYDPLLMLKALLLQQWYRLSDAELEEALNDRVSFRRFLGLSLEDAAPDHTMLCRFRNRLTEDGLAEKLFGEFERQLDQRGLLLKRGTMIDASLVETPHRPASHERGRAAVDPDAALTARKGQRGTHYGYKMHAGVDQTSRLIRSLKLTPANVNDTVPADELVRGDEQAIYADKAYAKRARLACQPGHQAAHHAQELGRRPETAAFAEAPQRIDRQDQSRGRRCVRHAQTMDALCPGPLSRPRQKCRPPQSSSARLQHEPLAKTCHLNCPNHSPRLANSNQWQNRHAQRSFSQLRNDPHKGEGGWPKASRVGVGPAHSDCFLIPPPCG